jgi:hypothetical protein
MKRFTQWWSTIPPILTTRTFTSKQWWSTIPTISTKQTNTSNHWTQKIPCHMTDFWRKKNSICRI